MKDVLAAAGVPTARYARSRRATRPTRVRVPRHAAGPLRGEDRRARRGQGRGRHRVDRRGARRGARLSVGRRVRRRGPYVRDRGGSDRARASRVRAVRRPRAAARSASRRTTSARSTATGPNTGGMGAYSPVPFVADDLVDEVMERAIRPTLARARAARRRVPRRALLRSHARRPTARRCSSTTCGSAIPSARSSMPAARERSLRALPRVGGGSHRDAGGARADARASAVVLASEGYPPAPTRQGDVIAGLDAAGARDGVIVFHAGTARRRRASRHDERRPRAHGRPPRASTSRAPGTVRTRPRPISRGRASTTVATSPPKPDCYVIPRYSLPEIADLFTDEARFGAWLEVEVLAVEAWAKLGVVPEDDARAVRERAGFDVERSTSARRSPSTTSPRSLTSCRSTSVRRPARGSTTG